MARWRRRRARAKAWLVRSRGVEGPCGAHGWRVHVRTRTSGSGPRDDSATDRHAGGQGSTAATSAGCSWFTGKTGQSKRRRVRRVGNGDVVEQAQAWRRSSTVVRPPPPWRRRLRTQRRVLGTLLLPFFLGLGSFFFPTPSLLCPWLLSAFLLCRRRKGKAPKGSRVRLRLDWGFIEGL
jgi:hypothetical protein